MAPTPFLPTDFPAGTHGYEPDQIFQEAIDYVNSIPSDGEAMRDLKEYLLGVDGNDEKPGLIAKLDKDPDGKIRLRDDPNGAILRELFMKYADTLLGRNLFHGSMEYKWIDGEVNGRAEGAVNIGDHVINGRRHLLVRIQADIEGRRWGIPLKDVTHGQRTVEVAAHEFIHLYFAHVCCHGDCPKGCNGYHSGQLGARGHGKGWELLGSAVEKKIKEIIPNFQMCISISAGIDVQAGLMAPWRKGRFDS